MGIVRMQKMAVLAHKEASDAIIVRLQEEGVLEVTVQESLESLDRAESSYDAAEIDFAIHELMEIAPKNILKQLKNNVLPGEVIAAAHSIDATTLISRLHTLRADDTALERELLEIETRSMEFMAWRHFEEALPPAMETTTCVRMFGTMQTVKIEEFFTVLHTTLPRTSLQTVGQDGAFTTLSAFVMKNDATTFEECATVHGWTTVRPPEGSGVPAAILKRMADREREIRNELKAHSDERLAMTTSLPDLVKVRTFTAWTQARDNVRDTMITTDSLMVITGWMPKNDIARIEQSLSSVSEAVALIPIKPLENDEAPVLIKNPLLIAPFESVTTLYGLPLPTEMDPTMALAPFFALFFALCITDAGYGFAIATIMGVYLFVTKQTIRKAPLWWAVFFGGIVAFFVGIPFGGWFGLDANRLPVALDFARTRVGDGYWFKFQVWNLSTQEGISFLQNLALFLGITHLFFGMFLAGWHKWIHGQKASAFWEHFTAHILLAAVILRAFAPEQYISAATYCLYAAVILTIWGKGYGNPWYLRPIMGVLGFLNFSLGMLSNGLSYLRILALGLVTGAIALAVDQVAIEMGKLFPVWIGIPVVILIAIVGHTVSIALNTLGSFIHAGRLQFIEFFSQFFEGGGRPFSPFSRTNNS